MTKIDNGTSSIKTSPILSVELFAGIGGFRIAADRLGIKTIFANDSNPLSCEVYRSNFGTREIVESDIRNILDLVPNHDLLTAGFPCQPFSSAGKKEGIRDPRGTLFQVIVDVLDRTQPKYFLLENVKRLLTMENGSHFATILSTLSSLKYWIEWRVLNTKDFNIPQNRERIIICGKRITGEVDFKEYQRKIRLIDPSNISKSFFGKRYFPSFDSWSSIEMHGRKFPNWGLAYKGFFWGYDPEDKNRILKVHLREILEENPSLEYDFTVQTLLRLSQNSHVNKFINGVEIISNQAGGARMGYTIFGVNGLAPTLTASTSRHYERYKIGDRYRRLTPKEYARLQGFPDDHCRIASNYDQYSLFGNAVPPPMVEFVMKQWLREEFCQDVHERGEICYA